MQPSEPEAARASKAIVFRVALFGLAAAGLVVVAIFRNGAIPGLLGAGLGALAGALFGRLRYSSWTEYLATRSRRARRRFASDGDGWILWDLVEAFATAIVAWSFDAAGSSVVLPIACAVMGALAGHAAFLGSLMLRRGDGSSVRSRAWIVLLAGVALPWCSACNASGPAGAADAGNAAGAVDPGDAVRAEVLASLDRYMDASRRVDAVRIAACYAPDGELFEPGISPIHGRESIREFIASFPGVSVEVATATPEVVEIFDGTAYVWGAYHEELSFPGQPASTQDGRFVMEFVRHGSDGWLIQRLFRVPLTTFEAEASTDRGR